MGCHHVFCEAEPTADFVRPVLARHTFSYGQAGCRKGAMFIEPALRNELGRHCIKPEGQEVAFRIYTH